MKEISPFQLVLMGILIIFAIAGFLVFAFIKSGGGTAKIAPITVWGTVDQNLFNSFIAKLNSDYEAGLQITYVKKDEQTFDKDFVEALASNVGPDIILLPQDMIIREKDRIFTILYDNISLRQFKDTFLQEGEMYLLTDGINALPFQIDPLVMYWNRDIFGAAAIANPPVSWTELFAFAPKLTLKDKLKNIITSGVALGEFRNITNAKEILSTLIMQAGNPIVARDTDGRLKSTLQGWSDAKSDSVEAALRFYTDFSNPIKNVYSWNRALPNSKNLFISGDLAIYFGFASEMQEIKAKNFNLNFDVARIPQMENGKTKLTFGKILGFSIVKNSKNIPSAFKAISYLTGLNPITLWNSISKLPPVRRDLLSNSPKDSYSSIFYDSAIRARAWFDPYKEETDKLFQGMVESAITGESNLSEVINRANSEMDALFR